MELDADDGQHAVADGHDLSVLGRGADLERVGHPRRGERVVAPALERVREAAEEAPAVVRDGARLAVHEAARLADLPAEGFDDRLVAEAHAERRHALAQAADDLDGGACVLRAARPGRDEEMSGRELLGPVGVDLVVADDGHFRAELLEEVGEVVREAVVVVDEEDHAAPSSSATAPAGRSPASPSLGAACLPPLPAIREGPLVAPSASSRAASSAASLRRHSSCSAVGSDSATIPAPACRRASPPSRTTVRIAMQVSNEPPGSA